MSRRIPVLRAGREYTGWIGFCDGEPDAYSMESYYHGVPHADLFPSKTAALRCYEDVRWVRIIVEADQPSVSKKRSER